MLTNQVISPRASQNYHSLNNPAAQSGNQPSSANQEEVTTLESASYGLYLFGGVATGLLGGYLAHSSTSICRKNPDCNTSLWTFATAGAFALSVLHLAVFSVRCYTCKRS